MKIDKSAFEFQWDTGNIDKNKKHGVGNEECEEVFSDEQKIIYKDVFHSEREERLIVLGKSNRRINKKEVIIYEKAA